MSLIAYRSVSMTVYAPEGSIIPAEGMPVFAIASRSNGEGTVSVKYFTKADDVLNYTIRDLTTDKK